VQGTWRQGVRPGDRKPKGTEEQAKRCQDQGLVSKRIDASHSPCYGDGPRGEAEATGSSGIKGKGPRGCAAIIKGHIRKSPVDWDGPSMSREGQQDNRYKKRHESGGGRGRSQENKPNLPEIAHRMPSLCTGRRRRDRTSDLGLVRAALSQLSYPPVPGILRGCATSFPALASNATGNATESSFRAASARSAGLTMW
jgi:hypothetical protein